MESWATVFRISWHCNCCHEYSRVESQTAIGSADQPVGVLVMYQLVCECIAVAQQLLGLVLLLARTPTWLNGPRLCQERAQISSAYAWWRNKRSLEREKTTQKGKDGKNFAFHHAHVHRGGSHVHRSAQNKRRQLQQCSQLLPQRKVQMADVKPINRRLLSVESDDDEDFDASTSVNSSQDLSEDQLAKLLAGETTEVNKHIGVAPYLTCLRAGT